MVMKLLHVMVVVVTIFFIYPNQPILAQQTNERVKIAYVGDQEIKGEAYAVLRTLREEGVQLVVLVGDFDYRDDPAAFVSMLNQELTQYNIPYIAAVGNHDLKKWSDYSRKMQEQLARFPEVKCTGEFGVQAVCTFKGVAILISGIGTYGNGHTTQTYMEALRQQLTAEKDTVWKVCAWHKNHSTMQVGKRDDEVPLAAYDLCREQGAMIVTAHEHTYNRTRTLKNMNPAQVDPEFPDAKNLMLKPGSAFVVVSGLGGHSAREHQRCLPTSFPYGCNDMWGYILTQTQERGITGKSTFGAYGSFIVEYRINGDPRKAGGYFRTISPKAELRKIDEVQITSLGGVAQPLLPGDTDTDADVDIYDYNTVIQHFGQTGAAGFIPADVVQDGAINIFDYNKVIENFGKKAS